MRLTTTIRDAFIRAAMQDVPAEDFGEQKQKLLQAEAREKLPPKVRAIYDDKELRDYLLHRYVSGAYVAAPHEFNPSAALLKKLSDLDQKRDAQAAQHNDLRNKLRSVAYSCSTRKALADALPDFAKYLPTDEAAAKKEMLPAVTNVVTDFVKAGWPKGSNKKAKASS